MSVTQDSYSERRAVAVAGLIATSHTCDVDSKLVEGTDSTRIPFGRGVGRGAVTTAVWPAWPARPPSSA